MILLQKEFNEGKILPGEFGHEESITKILKIRLIELKRDYFGAQMVCLSFVILQALLVPDLIVLFVQYDM